jgi:eukaryotic-like serine/threonine-protein kinase
VATTLYLNHRMKQPKILLLVVIALLPFVLISCSSIFGGAAVSRGWAGTAFSDGIIYVGTMDGRVVAINASTHSQQWNYTVNAAIYTTPIVDGDLVYVGTYSGQVCALTIAGGAERWVYPRTGSIGAIVGSPVVANETIYIGSSDGRVYALDTTYGDLKWESEPLADKLWTSPVISGDTLYVSTFDGYIYALSTETGELLDWSFASEAGFASSPVIYGDTIYVGSFDRHLYAVKIGSNVSMWKFPQEEQAGNWFWASPIVNEGIVYAGCLDGKLYALNATTGKEIWSYATGDQEGKPSPIIPSPVLMDNLLIIVNESGNVYVFDLNANPGDEVVPLKTISIGADVRSSFCAQEGLVYIRDENSKNNQLYVVDIDKGEVSWNFSLTK